MAYSAHLAPAKHVDRSLLPWVLAASAALHVVGVLALPGAGPIAARIAPSIVELAEAPLSPAPPPPPAAAERNEARAPTKAPPPPAAVRAPTAAPPRSATTAATDDARPVDDAPADFMGTVISNDGPGVDVRSGGAERGAPTGAPHAPSAPTRALAPRMVAPGDLSRPPRPPALDDALERNYPPDARRSGIAGRALLRVQILPDGRVGRIEHVSETFRGFADACERTVRGARWEPPIDRDGRPVATEIAYACRFEVRS